MVDPGWLLEDLPTPDHDAPTVVSTFASGGGSSMGYKRAGYRMIGSNDIDPEMMTQYAANLDSARHVVAPIGDLMQDKQLIDAWAGVDIVDGSPPCTSFSTVGLRDETWGKAKHFREGQAVQILDQLFFDYMDLVNALKPRVFIAENVHGMWVGNAKGYVKKVVDTAQDYGYDCQVFALSAADYGVPQYRRRLFFIGRRHGAGLKPLVKPAPTVKRWVTPREAFVSIPEARHEDKPLSKGRRNAHKYGGGTAYSKHVKGSGGRYGDVVIDPDSPRGNTIASASHYLHWDEPRLLRAPELLRMGTFPDDYKLASHKEPRGLTQYIVGMSVPPYFMQAIAETIRDQWFS